MNIKIEHLLIRVENIKRFCYYTIDGKPLGELTP